MKKFILFLFLLVSLVITGQTEQSYFENGKYNVDRKFWDEAIADLSQAIAINPTQPDYYWYRSKAYVNASAQNYVLDQGVQDAILDLDQMIDLGAASIKIYTRKGKLFELLGDDYAKKYQFFKPKKTTGWQDDGKQQAEKQALKTNALKAYNNAQLSYKIALTLDYQNKKLLDVLEYLQPKIDKLNE